MQIEQKQIYNYRAIIEIADNNGNPIYKNIDAMNIKELINNIYKRGDHWLVNHAHRCYLPYINEEFLKVDNITDLIKETLKMRRLNKEN